MNTESKSKLVEILKFVFEAERISNQPETPKITSIKHPAHNITMNLDFPSSKGNGVSLLPSLPIAVKTKNYIPLTKKNDISKNFNPFIKGKRESLQAGLDSHKNNAEIQPPKNNNPEKNYYKERLKNFSRSRGRNNSLIQGPLNLSGQQERYQSQKIMVSQNQNSEN